MPTDVWDSVIKGGVGMAALFVIWSLGHQFLEGWQEAEQYRYELDSQDRVALSQLAAAATATTASNRELVEEFRKLVSTYRGE